MDKDLIIPIAAGTLLFAILIIFVIYFITLYRKKQQEFEWEREQVKQARLKTEIEIKEQTLSNISRELHDNLGQIASLIKINLNLVSPDIKHLDKEKIDESLVLLKQLITDIKSLSITLKGENLQRFGLIKMIENDVERLKKLEYLTVEIFGRELLPKLGYETEIFLYRMSQEIFNNILQHAEATKASLEIKKNNSNITLTFTDNGKGYDMSTSKAGSGLMNLQERCKIIGANLKITSAPNKGTQTSIALKTEV